MKFKVGDIVIVIKEGYYVAQDKDIIDSNCTGLLSELTTSNRNYVNYKCLYGLKFKILEITAGKKYVIVSYKGNKIVLEIKSIKKIKDTDWFEESL